MRDGRAFLDASSSANAFILSAVEFFKVMDDVSVIINEVKKEGDDALKKFTKEFDGADIVNIEVIEVEDIEIENAYEEVEPELIEALENAAANIAAYHGSQVEAGISLTEVEPGLTLGYKVTPIASVGVYVPGGTAAYPSTALMTVIPAKVAGVMEVIVCTPPNKDGKINPLTLQIWQGRTGYSKLRLQPWLLEQRLYHRWIR